MDTSSWTSILSSLDHKSIRRTSPWFGKFSYCLKFHLIEAFCLRSFNHAQIDRVMDMRANWGRRMITTNYGGSWRGSWVPLQITDQMRMDVHRLCTFFQQETSDHKIMIAGDWIYVYTLDLDLPKRIWDLYYLDRTRMTLSMVDTVGKPGTVYLQNPKHLYRSYFRRQKLESDQGDRVRRFLSAQQGVRMSASLRQWTEKEQVSWVKEYYFIDHDDQGMLTMLALIDPGLIRKTLSISSDK